MPLLVHLLVWVNWLREITGNTTRDPVPRLRRLEKASDQSAVKFLTLLHKSLIFLRHIELRVWIFNTEEQHAVVTVM